MGSGWVKINRSLADNPLWTCEPFTRGQAWVDLIMLANHKDSFFYVRNIKVNVKRGQVAWSEPRLAERWKWSRTKVRKFLKDLEKEQQIIQQKSNVTQVITLVNYDKYQNKEQQQDSSKTAKEQQQDPYKNDKNEKNNKKGLEERKQDFAQQLKPYFEVYGSEMLNDFFEYWTEHGENDRKMRFEKEKSFGIKRRLATWNKNKYSKNGRSRPKGNIARENSEQAKMEFIARVAAQ